MTDPCQANNIKEGSLFCVAIFSMSTGAHAACPPGLCPLDVGGGSSSLSTKQHQ